MRSEKIQGKIVEQDVNIGNTLVAGGKVMNGGMGRKCRITMDQKKQPVNSP